MGITGLLPFVKNSCRSANIKDFSGATVAIDAYSWLHKGAFACAEKLVKGEKTDGYVFYCIRLLNMLIDAGVTPIMVFDGCNLASKAITEKKRRENRDKTRQRGKQFLCEGKVKEARECFQRCVDVTPEMAREVIQACRKRSIDCIVAPYEADAQLAYLDKTGISQLTITEDSDLILFGCSKILFKMDSCGGGLLFEMENLSKSFGTNASKFCFEKFRYMCILSGCDYLPSLPGIGLAKACKFFSLTSNTDLNVVLSKLPSYLKMPKLIVSDEYKESFIKANNTFLYQLAFCPKEKRLVPLNPYPEDVTADDMEYAGKYLENDLAYQLAMGNINVKTLEKFDSNDFQNSPSFNEDKSVVWGSGNTSKSSNPQPKKETAFKFNTPKRKIDTAQKRKFVEEDKSETEKHLEDELFSMYGGTNAKKNKLNDPEEEEPIVQYCDSSDKLNSSLLKEPTFKSSPVPSSLPLKKIVRSRFFSSESVQSIESSPLSVSTPSSSNASTGENFLSSSEVLESLIQSQTPVSDDKIKDHVFQFEEQKHNNKENIMNRFAKKKTVDISPNASKDNISHSTPKSESVSLLDVFNSESSSTTATVSSIQKSAKILSQTISEDHSMKLKPRSLFKKDSSKKLITTKIHDFKWAKEPICKTNVNLSLGSDGNSCEESLIESPEKNIVLKSPLKEISPYFLNSGNDSSFSMEVTEDSETVITILSDSEDVEQSEINNNVDSSPKSPNKSQLKNCSSSNGKLSKCRTIGLPKKKKIKGTVSRKESLLNFNFTRKSLSTQTS